METVFAMQALQACKSITLPDTFEKVPEEILRRAARLCPEDGRWEQVAACMRCMHCRSPGTVRLPDCSVGNSVLGAQDATTATCLGPAAKLDDSMPTPCENGTIRDGECIGGTNCSVPTRESQAKVDMHAAEECEGLLGQPHDRFLAFSHEGGCVKWGAVRKTVGEAVQDRKSLLAARRAGRLMQR